MSSAYTERSFIGHHACCHVRYEICSGGERWVQNVGVCCLVSGWRAEY